MLGLNRKVRDSWENAKGEPFDAIRIAQARCSGVHTIWNFFREKLILRLDLRFGPYLKAAKENAVLFGVFVVQIANLAIFDYHDF